MSRDVLEILCSSFCTFVSCMNSSAFTMAQALNVNEVSQPNNSGNGNEQKDSSDANPPPMQKQTSMAKAAAFIKETSLSTSNAAKERLTMEAR